MKKVLVIHDGIRTTTKIRYFIAGFFQVFGMLLNELMFGKSIETRDVEIEKANWSLIGYIVATCGVTIYQIGDFPTLTEKGLFIISGTIMSIIIIIIKKAYNNYKLKKYFNL